MPSTSNPLTLGKVTKMSSTSDPLVRILGLFISLWGLTVIGLLSWETNWLIKNEEDLSNGVHIWCAIAVGGSFFFYVGMTFYGLFITCGEDKAAEKFSNNNVIFLIVVFGGFIASCASINIWRTNKHLEGDQKKMIGWIGFTGISNLYILGLVIVYYLIYILVLGIASCVTQLKLWCLKSITPKEQMLYTPEVVLKDHKKTSYFEYKLVLYIYEGKRIRIY